MSINISRIWHNNHPKMMTHHSVMTSPLRIKILIIDKFGDFSCDSDYNSSRGVFRDVISLIINQCDPRRSQGDYGGHKSVRHREAHLLL